MSCFTVYVYFLDMNLRDCETDFTPTRISSALSQKISGISNEAHSIPPRQAPKTALKASSVFMLKKDDELSKTSGSGSVIVISSRLGFTRFIKAI